MSFRIIDYINDVHDGLCVDDVAQHAAKAAGYVEGEFGRGFVKGVQHRFIEYHDDFPNGLSVVFKADPSNKHVSDDEIVARIKKGVEELTAVLKDQQTPSCTCLANEIAPDIYVPCSIHPK